MNVFAEGSLLAGGVYEPAIGVAAAHQVDGVFYAKVHQGLGKVVEAWWTVLIELLWSKERILEVYLNVAEMGKGLYGAEVASQYFFGVPASELNPRQAVSIALCLPNPLSIHPDYLPAHVRKRFARIIHMLNSR